VPWVAAVAIGVIMVFVVPHVPHSPIACLARHQACDKGSQTGWMAWLCFVVPLAVACGIKMLPAGNRRP
jgi:hypothetical protein